MNYEATENDHQRAELAAHKIAPLFQCFQWQWHGTRGYYTPTMDHLQREFIRLIEDFKSDTCRAMETGRLGIKHGDDGYELYLVL